MTTTEVDEEPVIINAEDYQNMNGDGEAILQSQSSGSVKDDENNSNAGAPAALNVDNKSTKKEVAVEGYSAFDEPVMVPSKTTSSPVESDQTGLSAVGVSAADGVAGDYKELDPYDVAKPFDNNNIKDDVTDGYKQLDPYIAKPIDETKKIRKCNDVFWGVLFICHLLLVVAYLGIDIAATLNNAKSIPMDYLSTALLVLILGIIATFISTFALTTMMRHADELVKTALLFSVGFSLFVGLAGFIFGQVGIGAIGFFCFIVGLCYSKSVWHRIPYAAANLRTALTAVRLNSGTIMLAYQIQFLALIFVILFFIVLQEAFTASSYSIVFFLLLSYFWVQQVCQNVIHVTVAGVIATWWFVPDNASDMFSYALSDSLCRATTYSFGSICFGSGLVAFIKAIRNTIQITRQNDDLSFIVTILQCCLRGIEHIVEYFNKWAYVYVGVYGYGFLDAGRNVLTLFEQKGWTVLVTDDLVDNVLFMICIGIGLVTGILGWAVTKFNLDLGISIGTPSASGFLVGFLVGYLFSSISMGVVGSAVNTVIVCYVESPAEFSDNYPELFAEMRSAWQEAWPDEF